MDCISLFVSSPASVLNFHASARREEEAKAAEEPPKSLWEPIYSIPVGITLAVPALHYEWYLVNEETQLAACFIAFTLIVYKQFGGVIYEALEADGKRMLQEHNQVEDLVIQSLQDRVDEAKMATNMEQDYKDVKALKVEAYDLLNAAGKIKPQYDLKQQVERVLTLVQAEETNMVEKTKVALMAEATAAVQAQFASDKNLQAASLAGAMAQLQGSKDAQDPVKDAYLSFFAQKKKAKVDEAAEQAAARQSLVTKVNAIARSEGFLFELDESTGKPKMVAA